jgi:hypothetical protein
MPSKKMLLPIAAGVATIAGLVVHVPWLHGAEPGSGSAPSKAKTTTQAARVESAIVKGDPLRSTRGDLAIYAPAELAMRDGTFDLVVHFHGVAKNQETNVDEAKLPAVVVSANEGMMSDAYGKAFFGPSALDRVLRFAEESVSKRSSGAKVGRIALSSWSAGGAAVKNILTHQASRLDAVIVADGLFSSWEDEAKTSVRREPLLPFVDFARRAMNDEKLLVITHTAIATDYPNVEACTGALLAEIGLDKGAAHPETQPSGGTPTYAVDRGSLHVRGVDGKGPEDHIAQIRALDDAYAELRRRWAR